MSSFLFTSCYNVLPSLTSIVCLDNRTTRSETSTKTQCIFWWRKYVHAKISTLKLGIHCTLSNVLKILTVNWFWPGLNIFCYWLSQNQKKLGSVFGFSVDCFEVFPKVWYNGRFKCYFFLLPLYWNNRGGVCHWTCVIALQLHKIGPTYKFNVFFRILYFLPSLVSVQWDFLGLWLVA